MSEGSGAIKLNPTVMCDEIEGITVTPGGEATAAGIVIDRDPAIDIVELKAGGYQSQAASSLTDPLRAGMAAVGAIALVTNVYCIEVLASPRKATGYAGAGCDCTSQGPTGTNLPADT